MARTLHDFIATLPQDEQRAIHQEAERLIAEGGSAMANDVTIYRTDDRELHMQGNSVAVCWNLTKQVTQTMEPGGSVITIGYERQGMPYIDFAWMRQDHDGSWYEEEDSPVQGGLSLGAAREVLAELAWAISYLETITTTKKE